MPFPFNMFRYIPMRKAIYLYALTDQQNFCVLGYKKLIFNKMQHQLMKEKNKATHTHSMKTMGVTWSKGGDGQCGTMTKTHQNATTESTSSARPKTISRTQ